MGPVRGRVADAVDYGDTVLVIQLFEGGHAGVQPETVIERDHIVIDNPDIWPEVLVPGIFPRDDAVQVIVATRKLDDNQHLFSLICHRFLPGRHNGWLSSAPATGALIRPN